MSKKHYSNYAKMSTSTEPVVEEIVAVEEPVVEEVAKVEEPVAEKPVVKKAPKKITGVVCDCSKLNVRKAPNAKAEVICQIAVGTKVIIEKNGSTDEYYKVCLASGIEGFCMKKYIEAE